VVDVFCFGGFDRMGVCSVFPLFWLSRECCIDDFVGLGDWVLCCFDEYCIWNFSVWL
jgi:hypothetical protein